MMIQHAQERRNFVAEHYLVGTDYAGEPPSWGAINVVAARARHTGPFRTHPRNHAKFGVYVHRVVTGGLRHYLVHRRLWGELRGCDIDFGPHLLVHCCGTGGENFLWSVPLPRPGVEPDPELRTQLAAVEKGKIDWVTPRFDFESMAFRTSVSRGQRVIQAEWAPVTFEELIEAAFQGRVIDSLDHPALYNLAWEEEEE
jgi:hypothetical protein